MAAAAVQADRMTLGVVQVSHTRMRILSGTSGDCVDANPDNDGTDFPDALRALAALGLYPRPEAGTVDVLELRRWALRGVQVSIVYGVVPVALRGDPNFTGRHRVFLNAWRRQDGAYLVYDSLADARRAGIPQAPQWWPGHVVEDAAEAYQAGTGNSWAIVPQRRRARARGDYANVRETPDRTKVPMYRIVPPVKLEAGAKSVDGEAVAGSTRWWPVHVPGAGVGYVHDSVVLIGSVP